MSNRNPDPCPAWCINRAAVPHMHHTADVAEFELEWAAVEVTLSRHGADAASVRLFHHSGDDTTLVDLAPPAAAALAEILAAFDGRTGLAEALATAAAVLIVEEEAGR
jgi:hypothetical protein